MWIVGEMLPLTIEVKILNNELYRYSSIIFVLMWSSIIWQESHTTLVDYLVSISVQSTVSRLAGKFVFLYMFTIL